VANILAIISVGDTRYNIERLVSALSEIKRIHEKDKKDIFDHEYIDPIVKVKPKEAFYAEKKKVRLRESEGLISGEFVMCYPPGIPILAPGELITKETIDYIEYSKKKGSLVTGPEDMEIETFVHGAMCISYSGRCLLSNYLVGRDANRGACTHPCRWKYSIVEETRPGEYMPVFENERGTYIFNSKDLCMIDHMDDLLHVGVDSLKIEGRMKTALYVATVARTYRKAIDDYFESPEKYRKNLSWYQEQISNCTYRQFTTGFFYGKPDENAQIYDNNTYVKEYTYLGFVESVTEDGMAQITQRNKFSVGEVIEVMKPDGENQKVTVRRILDENRQEVESAPHPQQKLFVDADVTFQPYDILRRQEETA